MLKSWFGRPILATVWWQRKPNLYCKDVAPNFWWQICPWKLLANCRKWDASNENSKTNTWLALRFTNLWHPLWSGHSNHDAAQDLCSTKTIIATVENRTLSELTVKGIKWCEVTVLEDLLLEHVDLDSVQIHVLPQKTAAAKFSNMVFPDSSSLLGMGSQKAAWWFTRISHRLRDGWDFTTQKCAQFERIQARDIHDTRWFLTTSLVH